MIRFSRDVYVSIYGSFFKSAYRTQIRLCAILSDVTCAQLLRYLIRLDMCTLNKKCKYTLIHSISPVFIQVLCQAVSLLNIVA